MFSMTGYGRGSAPFGSGQLVVEIKSVNHRFMEVRCRAPKELLIGETTIEKLIRDRFSRGYVTVNLWYEGGDGSAVKIDRGATVDHLKDLVAISGEMDLCLADLIPVLAGAPDLYVPPRPDDEEELKKEETNLLDDMKVDSSEQESEEVEVRVDGGVPRLVIEEPHIEERPAEPEEKPVAEEYAELNVGETEMNEKHSF